MKVLSLLVPAYVVSELAYIKSGDICAGIEEPCSDAETCTATYLGPCLGDATAATWGVKSSVKGMAVVDEANYLDCTSETCDHLMMLGSDGDLVGFRDFSADEKAGGGTFAYTMAGQVVGDLSTMGAYVGVASFLNTGSVDIETQTNQFYTAGAGITGAVTRGVSDIGAPIGPLEVCIAEIVDGECGPVLTFEPAHYKFSIFGYTSGADYSLIKGSAGVPADATHFAVRMQLEAVGDSPITKITFNADNVELADLGNTDVLSMTLHTGSDSSLQYSFPQKYNVGSLATENEITFDLAVTKTVKIHAAPGDSASAISLDYLFELNNFEGVDGVSTYFVYDPTVTVAEDTTEFSAATAIQVGIFAASAIWLN